MHFDSNGKVSQLFKGVILCLPCPGITLLRTTSVKLGTRASHSRRPKAWRKHVIARWLAVNHSRFILDNSSL